jgi:HrpA-like RNA helicase
MSATLDANLFSRYFGNAPGVHIPGFMHPVEETYLEDLPQLLGGALSQPLRMAADAALRKVEEETIDPILVGRTVAALNERFADDDGNGAVLVFLPSWEAIRKVRRRPDAAPDGAHQCSSQAANPSPCQCTTR